MGAGPVAALGLAVLVVAVGRFTGDDARVPSLVRAAVPGLVSRPATRLVLLGVVAVLVPVGLYVAVNEVKFGELYRLPLERQVFSDIDPARQADRTTPVVSRQRTIRDPTSTWVWHVIPTTHAGEAT